MTVHQTIEAVDATAIMEKLGIVAIKRWPLVRRYTVELSDGSFGVGQTAGEAFDNAVQPDAFNVRRAA